MLAGKKGNKFSGLNIKTTGNFDHKPRVTIITMKF